MSMKQKRRNPGQVRMALVFYSILAVLIFFFIGLFIYAFITGGLPWDKKIKEKAKDTSVEESEED